MRRQGALDDLQTRLGHRFKDQALLDRALTHSSAISPGRRVEHSYQRLEFLGDRVLGLVIAELLYRKRPRANEGDLSRGLNGLVRRETCALVARGLDVGPALNLGEAEARTGGADKEAILADVCEALIGAVYLDGGLDAAAALIKARFGPYMDEHQGGQADAKTTLQEWAQAQGIETPQYQEIERSGPDHAPVFTIEVRLGNYSPVRAVGNSKKVAEHKAAEDFLIQQKVWKGTP